MVGQRILHFIVVIKTTNGTTLNGNIRSEQTFSDVFFGLSPYTEYRLSVVGVDEQGTAYKHNELTAWTDESGKLSQTYGGITVLHPSMN